MAGPPGSLRWQWVTSQEMRLPLPGAGHSAEGACEVAQRFQLKILTPSPGVS